MIEIAIALGVIAFALVGIMAILPSGLTVQKETRERTIIDNEADYFMDAIRRGLYMGTMTNTAAWDNDLWRFVEQINVGGVTYRDFATSGEVIGLLSQPHSLDADLNVVGEPNWAIIRPVNGSAIERADAQREFAFKYRMNVYITPAVLVRPDHLDYVALATNMWDLKLEFAWPVLPNDQAMRPKAVYRATVPAKVVHWQPASGLFFDFADPGNGIYTFLRP